mgnify:CR=1 FL=1
MADTMIGGGSGGSMVIMLRVLGISGTTIRATCDSNTVSGTIGSTGYLYLKLKTLGVWSVTASKSGYSFTQDVKVFRYGITEIWALAKKAFYDCTTTEIQVIAQSGMVSQYWSVGDYHKITMTDGEEIEVAIADFNHDTKSNGEIAPLTLVMRNCFNTKRTQDAHYGIGWANTIFRTSTIPSILGTFPSDWQSIMTPVKKKTANTQNSSILTETTDTLWLLSQIEVFGDSTQSPAGEGTVYPVFSDDASRKKTVKNVASPWFLRSFYGPDQGYKCSVGDAGNRGYQRVDENSGICLGFCIG